MSLNTNSTLFRQQAYINGQWVNAKDNSLFDVTNPANGEVIARVSNVGATETQQAIEAAEQALPAWRAKSAKERSQILNKWFRLMMENQKSWRKFSALSKVNPSMNRWVKLPMVLASLSGLPKKVNVLMVKLFHPPTRSSLNHH